MQFVLAMEPASLRRAWLISRASRPTWESPMSPSISARGVRNGRAGGPGRQAGHRAEVGLLVLHGGYPAGPGEGRGKKILWGEINQLSGHGHNIIVADYHIQEKGGFVPKFFTLPVSRTEGEALCAAGEQSRLMERAVGLLAQRPMSRKELLDKLHRAPGTPHPPRPPGRWRRRPATPANGPACAGRAPAFRSSSGLFYLRQAFVIVFRQAPT